MIGWQLFWSIEPPLADRIELALGILASLTANINRDSKRRPEAFTPEDFMVNWAGRVQEEEPEDGMAPERVMATMERLMRHQEHVAAQSVGHQPSRLPPA